MEKEHVIQSGRKINLEYNRIKQIGKGQQAVVYLYERIRDIKLEDYFIDNQFYYIVTEYIEG